MRKKKREKNKGMDILWNHCIFSMISKVFHGD